jgi:LuxR family maltose regulon positive regulatory protein
MIKKANLNSSPAPWFFATKLSPPKTNSTLMQREFALSRVEEASEYPLGLITAPAGFGKSSVLTQWYQSSLSKGNIVGWVSLDYADSDIRRFASYFIMALDRAGVEMGALTFAAEQCLVELSINSVLSKIIHALANINQNIFLIFDDYYQAESSEVNNFVSSLLEYAPDKLHIILSSRSQPDIQVGSKVVNGTAFEVEKQSLCFSLEEIKDYVGDEYGDNCAEKLLAQTEGWAVAIQLAIVANKGNKEIINLFSGKQQYIVNYFTEQILDQSTDLERRFLLYTSILDKFNVSLAKAVCDIDDVPKLIYDSKNIQSLVVTLDKEETWFRYHHLFSDLLFKKLKRDSEATVYALHRKASLWFEHANQIDEAVKHARLSGDVDRAVALFLKAGGWELVLYGGVSLMRTLLRNFSVNDFERHPQVRLAYIYLMMKDGDIQEADAQLQKIHIIDEKVGLDAALQRDFYVIHSLLRIYKDDNKSADSIAKLESLANNLNTTDVLGRAVLRASLTLAALACGKFSIAKIAAKAGLNEMRQADSILGVNYLFIHLGQIELHQANLDVAQAYLTEAGNMAEINFGIDSRLKTNCDINLQALNFWQEPNQLNADKMLELLSNACDTDGWFEIYASGFTSILEFLRIYQGKELAWKAISLITLTVRKRQIQRLAQLELSLRLTAALISRDANKIMLVMETISEGDIFLENEDHSYSWLPFCETTLALGIAYLDGYKSKNIEDRIETSIKIARRIGAILYLIRLLVLKGTLAYSKNAVEAGVKCILEAAQLAANQSIKTPFFMSPIAVELMQTSIELNAANPSKLLETNFLKNCFESRKNLNVTITAVPQHSLLSKREMEVMSQLAAGKANKEIARNLDMTGNTVKFHLKNIFAKLAVDKRINAVNRARYLNLI